MGDIRRAGIYTALIRSQTPLDTVDADLLLDRPQLMAYGPVQRKEMLGGAAQ